MRDWGCRSAAFPSAPDNRFLEEGDPKKVRELSRLSPRRGCRLGGWRIFLPRRFQKVDKGFRYNALQN